ncbi:MAG: hypothetical protein A3C50_00495 [Candidatus Staskawiczbacteria bacterium RIFCSPHIGHO2_02_FULL_43_16]|uniref:Uncharacterized protein n=1 Tax=Candidatus Staskawiczbacteria bacterium RIFCSPHIGHO2_01_FULL_41_41 TaxID=1802203 RepID=A0A1G2HSI5_9BACT|nr:MAG: hypothetical protein A2822_04395 [Candidatus Staskawiczbacteria bacterium RIFCSPHIGHO2_01_FULL_41_41]OGZ68244.1 MAG: hypothetical protein A3C50_00495 [Candidatus Staskawiczbacteria bacterium RIFCSPHIGHO2_02_FULL_43_16]
MFKYLKNFRAGIFKKIPLASFHKRHGKPILMGLVFTCLFSVVFYVAGVNNSYLLQKFPAAIPFLVADEVLNAPLDQSALNDEVVDDTPVEEVDGDGNPIAYPSRLTQLDIEVKEAGIPIHGMSLNKETREVRINFKPEATEEQKARAQEIVDNFDWVITYRDIFDAQKAKDQMMKEYPPEKLVAFSSYFPMIHYFLDHKEFRKLKSFMNNLFVQNIISQEDYMVFADILDGQKIYFNLAFNATPETTEPEVLGESEPEPTLEPEPTPESEPAPQEPEAPAESESESEPTPEPEPAPQEPEAPAEPAQEPEPEPEPESEPESESTLTDELPAEPAPESPPVIEEQPVQEPTPIEEPGPSPEPEPAPQEPPAVQEPPQEPAAPIEPAPEEPSVSE